MSVDITGMDAIFAAMDLHKAETRTGIEEVLHVNGQACHDTAYNNAPVGPDSTGHTHMRDALAIEEESTPDFIEVRIGIQDDGEHNYSQFVEQGHMTRSGTHVPAQPFLFPAFEHQRPKVKDDLGAL